MNMTPFEIILAITAVAFLIAGAPVLLVIAAIVDQRRGK